MVAIVPNVTNWSVTPQNGQVGYFTLMNTWLFESTNVISSLNTAIAKINEAGQDINDIGTNAINAIMLDAIEDLETYTGTGLVMIKDINRGGTFISKTVVEIDPNTGSLYTVNNITVFSKYGGGFWARQYTGAINIGWANIGVGGETDMIDIFEKAIEYLPVSGGSIEVPTTENNTWYFSRTLNIRKKVHIFGVLSTGFGNERGTKFLFAPNSSGIIFNSINTSLYTTVSEDIALPGCDGSIFENVLVLGQGGSLNPDTDGVYVRATVTLRKVSARGFNRYGIAVVGDLGAGGALEGNANAWYLENCKAIDNGSHGIYVDGADANVGVAIRCTAHSNGGYGIYDNSFLGNTWVGCDTAGNTTGAVWANRSTSSSIFIGHWEDGADESLLGQKVMAFGGNINASSSSIGFNIRAGIANEVPFKYQNTKGALQIGAYLGRNDTSMTALSFGSTTESASLDSWKLKHDSTLNTWFLQFANSSSFQPIAFPNSSNLLYLNKSFAGPIFRNGYAVYAAGTSDNAITRTIGSSSPSTGTHSKGDIVYNTNPSPGGFVGWICTTAGTPGTWKTFGAISA